MGYGLFAQADKYWGEPVFPLRSKTGSPSFRRWLQDGPPCSPLSVDRWPDLAPLTRRRDTPHAAALLWLPHKAEPPRRFLRGGRWWLPVTLDAVLPDRDSGKPWTRVARWTVCEDSPFGPTATARRVTSSRIQPLRPRSTPHGGGHRDSLGGTDVARWSGRPVHYEDAVLSLLSQLRESETPEAATSGVSSS